MKKLLRILLLTALPFLTACAGTTAEELRANPGEKATFLLDIPYKTALRNYTTTFHNCYATHMTSLVSYLVVKENDEGTQARVDYVTESLSRIVQQSMDFIAEGGQTRITFYRRSSLLKLVDTKDQITEWASSIKTCNGSF